jgi:hypothetical protein
MKPSALPSFPFFLLHSVRKPEPLSRDVGRRKVDRSTLVVGDRLSAAKDDPSRRIRSPQHAGRMGETTDGRSSLHALQRRICFSHAGRRSGSAGRQDLALWATAAAPFQAGGRAGGDHRPHCLLCGYAGASHGQVGAVKLVDVVLLAFELYSSRNTVSFRPRSSFMWPEKCPRLKQHCLVKLQV